MISISRINPNSISLTIDLNVFNDQVVSKMLYWVSDSFFVFWSNECGLAKIQLEKKKGIITNEEFKLLKLRLNQDLIDFKTRDIVNQETKTIRELLLVKAFATTDEFDEESLFHH